MKSKKAFIGFIAIVFLFNIFEVQAKASENVTKEIKNILNKYYIKDVSQDVLNQDSVSDIINNLNDPYTEIMNTNDYNNLLNNTFLGIGINAEMMQDGARVTSIIVNSPAMKSGIKEGDVITAVNNNYLKGLSIDNAMDILNGEQNIENELKVLRDSIELTINITPEKVHYPTVYSKIINSNTAYIHIMYFGENTLNEFKYILDSLKVKSINNFIIDLRNNLGGYIYSALELAGYFIEDDTFAIAKDKNGNEFKFFGIEKSKTIDKPTIFLVNKYTASAAEMLAACVQDYNKAVIVGETTYGKGVVQSTFQLSDGSILKATTLEIYSPTGRKINNVGISPDISINRVDSLIAGELLAVSKDKYSGYSKIVKVGINNKSYYLDLNGLKNRDYWEAYGQIISQSSSIDLSNYSQINQGNKTGNSYPILKYAQVPKTEYKVGERISFKFNSPNYNGFVQYRAMLWNDTTNRYENLWNTKDLYYDKWKPKGKDTFTISFPISKPGNYRIKVFVKRSGIENSKTALKGMNCDSYVYEVPFQVTGE